LDLRERNEQDVKESSIGRSFTTCPLCQLKLRRMGWVGHVACMGDARNSNRILVGKPERR
jgi:hypothetical protein